MNSSTTLEHLHRLSRLIRYWIVTMTHKAGSGHPTSSLSAVELMAGLLFGGSFRFRADDPGYPNNDRLIFSKGHASPLLYALWAAAGRIGEDDLMGYRTFGSPLEGHPTARFAYAEAATGSLGQGLSIGVGMALAARLDDLPYRTYVLLGDSEMAEGSQWEAIQLAAHYGLNNLVGVLDVNRLGQRGPTMYGHDLEAYRRRVEAFGWEALVVEDGHDYRQVLDACDRAAVAARPAMIIARTIKGKGVAALEDADGFHGLALSDGQLAEALGAWGEIDRGVRGQLAEPEPRRPGRAAPKEVPAPSYEIGSSVATRDGYGNALRRLAPRYPQVVALDGEVCNSTRAEFFRDAWPDRFFEMYIAEQAMAGAALGLALRGRTPFVSTFAAFMTRAFDQIRMSRHSDPDLKFVGSHAGVAIGPDGPSQMGLEDIALFRTVLDSVVLQPCDAMSAERLVEAMLEHRGIAYLRTMRGSTPVLYGPDEAFPIGGCKVLRSSDHDSATLAASGITVHQALAAYDKLADEGIFVRVIDVYSIKPLDEAALRAAADQTGLVVTAEDHYAAGGLGEAVAAALADHPAPVHILAVRRQPRSGKPLELLDDQGLSGDRIARTVRLLVAQTVP
ncbi:MAG: transketolase [Planctomycetes bacterium]|nr:transketolase [Planctomycetota bacterium]